MNYYSRKSVQGTNYYLEGSNIEAFRYNPSRKRNREIAEDAYKNDIDLDFPLHMIIEISSLCNLKCGFCNREKLSRPQTNMELEVYKKVVDQCAEGWSKNKVYSLSLYALGEPFLNPNLRDMIIYAKGKGIPYVDISTNGTFDMTPVLGTGLNELILSIDGDKETHERLRKGANYDLIFDNIIEFLQDRADFGHATPLLRVQAIGHFIGKEKTKEFIDYWIKRADVVYIKNLETFSHTLGDKNLEQSEINARLKNRKPCKQLWFSLTVNSNGEIAYCCHDPRGKSIIGNIRETTMNVAWGKVISIRNAHKAGEYTEICSRCVDTNW